jgi:prepilin-type N-terminal cleavage/methylation domain-containing protein
MSTNPSNSLRARVRKAFTLIEILIVVVILGILAGIVVPQFTTATNDARAGNLSAQLSSVQNMIELYAARNNGAYPDLSTNWDELTVGDASTTGDELLKDEPVNPAWPDQTDAAARAVSQDANGTGSASTGWFFNTTDNLLYASYFLEEGDGTDPTPRVTTTATD